jgi:cytidylate kinase
MNEDSPREDLTALGEPSARTVITIDGPAASGKSSDARLLAQRLGVAYVSSGLLYRAATLMALRQGVSVEDEGALLDLLKQQDVRLHPEASRNSVTIDWVDVTDDLHTEAVDASVSVVAKHPRVRAWVNDRLREMGGSFVIDGRDMGTNVFPDAIAKFYLTADASVRAQRRAGERGADLALVTSELVRRDERDRVQLAPAPDAITIDTGPLTLAMVVEQVLTAVLRVLPAKVVSP